jgi:hypothetical protein
MQMAKDPEPQPPQDVAFGHVRYNGRDFYGTGLGCNGHADMRAEVTYLRDWQAWAQRQLNSAYAWQRSVNEALNSGDGSYRP